jgi:hypothetical protein
MDYISLLPADEGRIKEGCLKSFIATPPLNPLLN